MSISLGLAATMENNRNNQMVISAYKQMGYFSIQYYFYFFDARLDVIVLASFHLH